MLIPLSTAEKERIDKQGWTAADGVEPSKLIMAGLNQYRLGHQANGACVFLDANKRCRIHAKFGEAAKPLACRLFPLLIFPAGRKVLVGLRFSCPAAAANRGKPLGEQSVEISRLAREYFPDGYEKLPPPAVAATPGLEWPDFLRFVRWLEATFSQENVPVAVKLLRALQWLDSVERGHLDQIAGESADEILEALVRRAGEKVPALPSVAEKPSRFGRLFLRLLVLDHARATTVADRAVGSSHRWKLLAASFSFAMASGQTPALREELKTVPFAEIERPFGPLPADAEALLDRYFRVKVQSLQFCGRGFHDCSLIEGFRNLALLYPIILWLARWLAVSHDRENLLAADVMSAISMADHQYGFTPYVSWRTRLLQQRGDIVRLCGWYAR
jgi:lysine-N-methylase